MMGKAGGSGRVMMVMHSGDARMFELAATFEERGFRVERVIDEAEAKRRLVGGSAPDLLVVDEADRASFSDEDGGLKPPLLVLPAKPSEAARASEEVIVSAVERILGTSQAPAAESRGEALRRLASLGLVTASVAHELSSPLAAVWMELGELERHIGDRPEAKEALAAALEAMERTRVILNDVRELSRTGDPARVPCDVRGVLDRTLRLLRPKLDRHATVTKEYGPTPLVAARDGRLGQLFVNLLSNAADALPPWETARNTIRIVTSMSAAGECLVEIIDNGRGIAKEELPHIFEPFFTTKGRKGTGLGLSLCHGIVKTLGGRIEVESSVGVGSRFRVILPPHESSRVADSPSRGAPPALAAEDATVLIVDRDRNFAKALSRALTPIADVVIVDSLQEAAARGDREGVLLCEAPHDAALVGSFLDSIEHLRHRLPPKVVFMADDAISFREAATGSGRQHRVIAKPFEVSQLMTLLNRERWS
jgi:signal transduction histidine kinase